MPRIKLSKKTFKKVVKDAYYYGYWDGVSQVTCDVECADGNTKAAKRNWRAAKADLLNSSSSILEDDDA